MARPAYIPDNYVLALIATVGIASVAPCSGDWAHRFELITDVAIGLLFFLHGAKLSREAAIAALTHWRLHLLVLASTFVLFPAVGLALKPLVTQWISSDLYAGLLFVCVLPSTVQSSIALTSLARGNVPAAVCAASASTLLGIFLTPLLTSLLITRGAVGGNALASVQGVVVQLLLPFAAGQIARPWLGRWIDRNKNWLKMVDQGSILLVVYTAFSAAVIEGLWSTVSVQTLLGLLIACALLLGVAMVTTTFVSRRMHFNKEDEITIVFCGSKKSLASGVPMAKVLFSSQAVGAIVLPLMLFHQMQLMVCALMAQRYARRPMSDPTQGEAGGAEPVVSAAASPAALIQGGEAVAPVEVPSVVPARVEPARASGVNRPRS